MRIWAGGAARTAMPRVRHGDLSGRAEPRGRGTLLWVQRFGGILGAIAGERYGVRTGRGGRIGGRVGGAGGAGRAVRRDPERRERVARSELVEPARARPECRRGSW